ncbi:MAG: RnfABCDGE type electron transport complex subunit D [Candidatus Spechtbacterales bacterium]|nr:RnfABCDGE type electron transport complex subunit D [Candidatus Spechtbacterales bacterium]
MYKLARYYLASLILVAIGLSFFGFLTYNPLDIILFSVYLPLACYIFNIIFGKITGVKPNYESAFIAGLILILIITPADFFDSLFFLTTVSFLAMASKYILSWRGRHIFNPAAFGVFLTAIIMGEGASWWVGDIHLVAITFIFGVLVTYKINSNRIVYPFLATYLLLISTLSIWPSVSLTGFFETLWQLIAYSPILFFAFIMLPEPRTSPTKKWNKLWYAITVAVAFVVYPMQFNVSYGLEAALLTGNVLAFLISKQAGVKMSLVGKEKEAENVFSFWFKPKKKINFEAGQFFEWTVNHKNPDSRGIRRYFTIASSPTEDNFLISMKVPNEASTFKRKLLSMKPGDSVIATGPMGDFNLPEDKDVKLVFIAGGIGVTPFRSMIKYMIDKNLNYNVDLIYLATSEDEFSFSDLFKEAKDKLNFNIFYTTERLNKDIFNKYTNNLDNKIFYISGPESMVRNTSKILENSGVDKRRIKRDYFPGYENL